VADAEGKELSLPQLQALADRLSEHYRARGYLLSHAYVPAQDVRDGTVEIAVVEVRVNTLSVKNAAGVGGMALAPLARIDTSKVLEGASLERALLLLSDLPGMAVQSTIRPGAQSGTSDLEVDVAPGKRYDGSIDFDNGGSGTSGRYRLGGLLNVNNPLNIGDLLSLRAIAKPQHARRPPKKTGTSPVPAQHPACGKPASIAADMNSAALPASCQASQTVRLPARAGAKAARVHRAMAKARNVEVTLRCFVRPR
jgi:hemolysin activation/secretion protein